ncbi:unnamed protein product [Rotaria magnacalcarata]|uniref:Uncharacterized protein n=9 Tax=Rotaria magnacalcarata TaxID=392030 RepID=A0A815PP89_9BILA|nr:unnamed protein product [Rotaria magnacalcarata]CAF2090223.1 unnamed protein product [Rotaria magnacalcarata]CAF2180362.1 unnamed protein product [Rotaria magnacalcarata]
MMSKTTFPTGFLLSPYFLFKTLFMAVNNNGLNAPPKQMSDSWIVVDDQDESEFVVIENEHDKQQKEPTPKPSPQSKRPLESNNKTNISQPLGSVTNSKQHNKKRKWKVLYSLPSTGFQGNVNAATLDTYVMDQYEQLFDKRDLFSSQQRIITVK